MGKRAGWRLNTARTILHVPSVSAQDVLAWSTRMAVHRQARRRPRPGARRPTPQRSSRRLGGGRQQHPSAPRTPPQVRAAPGPTPRKPHRPSHPAASSAQRPAHRTAAVPRHRQQPDHGLRRSARTRGGVRPEPPVVQVVPTRPAQESSKSPAPRAYADRTSMARPGRGPLERPGHTYPSPAEQGGSCGR